MRGWMLAGISLGGGGRSSRISPEKRQPERWSHWFQGDGRSTPTSFLWLRRGVSAVIHTFSQQLTKGLQRLVLFVGLIVPWAGLLVHPYLFVCFLIGAANSHTLVLNYNSFTVMPCLLICIMYLALNLKKNPKVTKMKKTAPRSNFLLSLLLY